jgi:carbamate kinase
MENLKERADKIRIQNSNEVRTEKMFLETAITANYNKFTKEYNEKLKREEIDKENRYYEMQYMDN